MKVDASQNAAETQGDTASRPQKNVCVYVGSMAFTMLFCSSPSTAEAQAATAQLKQGQELFFMVALLW